MALLGIDALRYIMNIFYGPFLSLYFFKISADSVTPISIYNIIAHAIVGLAPVVLGIIIKERYQLSTFRLGVILNFVYVLFIMIEREAIVDHLGILAGLFGLSTALYYYPHNMLNGVKIDQKIRDNFELTKKTIISIAGVAVPFLLGLFITTTDFYFATIAVLVLSAIQIVLSFLLKPFQPRPGRYQPMKALRVFLHDRTLRAELMMDLFRGMTVSDSAMQVLMPLLIFNSFKTDLNLGIVSSITNLLLILVSFLYLKGRHLRGNKWVLSGFALVPLVGMLAYLLFTNDMTLVAYYICYNLAVGILQLVTTIKIYNVAGLPVVKRGLRAEYWSIRELFQAFGKVGSFVLLLAAGLVGGWWMYVVLAGLTLMLWPLTWAIRRVQDRPKLAIRK